MAFDLPTHRLRRRSRLRHVNKLLLCQGSLRANRFPRMEVFIVLEKITAKARRTRRKCTEIVSPVWSSQGRS